MALAGALCGCGQRGPLYLPRDPAAAQRATLPQVLTPDSLRGDSRTPAAPSANPVASPATDPTPSIPNSAP